MGYYLLRGIYPAQTKWFAAGMSAQPENSKGKIFIVGKRRQNVALTVIILSLWFGPRADAAEAGVLSYAEKPVRIIRGVSLYRAVTGASLEAGDIIETEDRGVQIEGPGLTIMALGPHSKLYLGSGSKAALSTSVLQTGWLKIQAKPTPPDAVAIVNTPRLNAAVANGLLILHVQPALEEIFVEEGAPVVAELDARRNPARSIKIERDQFGLLKENTPFELLRRPRREFISTMPPAFRDALTPVAMKIKARVPLEKGSDVAFADIDAWLSNGLGLEKTLVPRFRPRLKDAEFRKALDSQLGHTPEWKPLLHPPAPRRPIASSG